MPAWKRLHLVRENEQWTSKEYYLWSWTWTQVSQYSSSSLGLVASQEWEEGWVVEVLSVLSLTLLGSGQGETHCQRPGKEALVWIYSAQYRTGERDAASRNRTLYLTIRISDPQRERSRTHSSPCFRPFLLTEFPRSVPLLTFSARFLLAPSSLRLFASWIFHSLQMPF